MHHAAFGSNPRRAVRLALAGALLAMFGTGAIADPAPWYYWRSIYTNAHVCAQFSPGDAWVKDGGPYKDARCASRY